MRFWRQSMQMKCTAPSTVKATKFANVRLLPQEATVNDQYLVRVPLLLAH